MRASLFKSVVLGLSLATLQLSSAHASGEPVKPGSVDAVRARLKVRAELGHGLSELRGVNPTHPNPASEEYRALKRHTPPDMRLRLAQKGHLTFEYAPETGL